MKIRIYIACFAVAFLQACGSGSQTVESTGVEKSETPITETKNEVADNPTSKSGRYQKGSELYVYAKSGLTLRSKPDLAGKKISLAKHHARLKVIDDAPFTVPFSVKEDCGLEVKGHWVMVSDEVNVGYAFDGYLMDQEPISNEDSDEYWDHFSKRIFSTTTPPKDDVEYYVYSQDKWENGVEITFAGYVGGHYTKTILPKALFDFREAYLFGISEAESTEDNPYHCECDQSNLKVHCELSDGLGAITLQKNENGDWFINESYAD